MIENFETFYIPCFYTVHIQLTLTWMRKILVHFLKKSDFKPAHFSHPVRTPVGKGVKATTPKGMNYPLRFVPCSAGAFRKPRETSWCEFKDLSSYLFHLALCQKDCFLYDICSQVCIVHQLF